MSIKLVLTLLVIHFFIISKSQNIFNDTIRLGDNPVVDGTVYTRTGSGVALADPGRIVNIYSSSSDVFNMDKGKVYNLNKDKNGLYTLVVNNNRGKSFVYSNLQQVDVSIGKKIPKGIKIGTMKKNNQNTYNLYFALFDKNVSCTFEETIKYLKKEK